MAQPLGVEEAPPTAVSVLEGPKSAAELENLIAKATAKYAVKDYSAAAEEYSRATELQAELNGEMSAQNADLLYLYGRCLYHVAVENSDVLGAKVAKEEKEKKKAANAKPRKESGEALAGGSARGPKGERIVAIKEDGEEAAAEDNTSDIPEEIKTEEQKAKSIANGEDLSKPYFTFTGDENFDVSDEEGEEVGEEEEEDPEDDFSNAFEVLDIARVLLEKRISELEANRERQEAEGSSDALGHTVIDLKKLKERLADTRDLQAEISLEAERFSDAATDLRAALEMKQKLFPEESSLIAEAHYKLSLALEFSAITPATDADGNPQPGTVGKVDQALRDEAAHHMERAIESCKKRIVIEEQELASGTGPGGAAGQEEKKATITQKTIDEVKEMVGDMEQRLKELKEPPVNVSAVANQPDASELSGILGSLIGESPEAQKAKLDAVVSNANDLSSLVKKKKPTAGDKRKADDANTNAEGQAAGKKPKQAE